MIKIFFPIGRKAFYSSEILCMRKRNYDLFLVKEQIHTEGKKNDRDLNSIEKNQEIKENRIFIVCSRI